MPNREITTHRVNGCNDGLRITTDDDRTIGGAPTLYLMDWRQRNASGVENPDDVGEVWLRFQSGPIAEVGTNGVTLEALLAIVADRLEGFQRGPYACGENAEALYKVRGAMIALKRRTGARIARGVEGTHAV